jgi:hypothetical protein
MHKRAQAPVKPKLQSRETTAAQCNVNIRTIDKLLKRGDLQGVKLGRRMLVTVESAEALVAVK